MCLDDVSKQLLKNAMERLNHRLAYDRILKVARTIADLDVPVVVLS
jgi:predicted ATPase with chaperone activity